MRILFTKSSLPFSKLICWGLDEPVSHTAILFSNGTVIHSTFSGIVASSYKDFCKEREVVLEVDVPITYNQESKILDRFPEFVGKPYDFTAFTYFTWRAFLRKMFKVQFPPHSKWNTKGRFLCTELATKILFNEEMAMLTPYGLYAKILKEL